MPVKLGDVERMLPYGMYLHKQHEPQRFHSVARLTMTNTYVTRKNTILEQNEIIKEQRERMQTELLERKKVARTDFKDKKVPITVQSSKFIQQQKKQERIYDEETGQMIMLTDLVERSKKGEVSKR